ncbi:MAG: hypothetical protein A4E67_00947 [Syntrophaceae bacterium PtaB.Bin038]|nr:MAG: hypothetical protein A4E67_00947 [Syntrophaceae bacterium PtaB.Bin038]
MLLDVIQHRRADRAGQRVLAVRVAVDEGSVLLLDDPVDLLLCHDDVERGVAAGEALGGHDQVGDDAPVVEGPVAPRPAHARHDLVGDEQHVVLVTDLADALEVTVLRHEGPRRGPNDGLGDEGRHGVGTLVENRLFELVGALHAAPVGDEIEGAAVAVAGRNVRRVKHERLVVAASARVAAQGKGAERVAVIARPSGDDLELQGKAAVDLVLPGHLHCRLDGLGAAGQEVDPGQPRRRHLHDPLGQSDGRLARELGAVGEGDAAGLLQHGLLDLLDAVTDIHHGGPSGSVDVPPAFLVVDIDALSALHGGVVLGRGPVEDVILIDFLRHGCLPGRSLWDVSKVSGFYQMRARCQ